jgi:coenzyme F420-0:L-glutamate ligase/coenzyme F420-1:gamma-L-glutamate ligase
MPARLEFLAPAGMPRIQPGDDLAALLLASLAGEGIELRSDDVLIVAQKVVSKAEGRYVRLADVSPSARAVELAGAADKDPRVVELILRESREVVRVRPGVIVVEHRNGYVHANAGIDQSNIPQDAGGPQVLLLPEDADASARRLRDGLESRSGVAPGVVINDSVGRAWRNGTIGMALGSAGITTLLNRNGEPDMYGRPLRATEVAIADELAAAASLLMGEAAEERPLVLVRGGSFAGSAQDCSALIRDRARDMFR